MNRTVFDKRRKAALCAQSVLAQAGLSRAFSVEELISRSVSYLGYPITLLPFECPPKGDGAVFAASGKYIICYRANTDELHRRYIIMHELAHLTLGHSTPIEDGWLAFTPEMEMEADLLAEMLVSRSLGVYQSNPHRFLSWCQQRLSYGMIPEQDRLRSLFE